MSELDNLFEEFDQVAKQDKPARPPASKNSRSSSRRYRSALEEQQTDRRKTAKATGRKASVAGQYMRRSFTFRPEQLEEIEAWANELGLSQNDLIRWFVDMGIEAVVNGEEPPLKQEVRHRYDPNQMG